jgi:hypothetical protein
MLFRDQVSFEVSSILVNLPRVPYHYRRLSFPASSGVQSSRDLTVRRGPGKRTSLNWVCTALVL